MSVPRLRAADLVPNVFVVFSFLLCLMLPLPAPAAFAAGEPPPGTCTRLPGAPEYPLPLLGDLQANQVIRGDLDRDGTRDLLALTRGNDNTRYIWRVNFHGEEPADFELLVELPRIDDPFKNEVGSILIGDFDGDDLGDIVVVRDAFRDDRFAIDLFLGEEGGGFNGPERLDYQASEMPSAVAGDFDADGVDELVTLGGFPRSYLRMHEFSRAGGWTDRIEKFFDGYALTTGDIDGDGILDVIHLAPRDRFQILWVHFGDAVDPLSAVSGRIFAGYPSALLTTMGHLGEPAQIVYHQVLGQWSDRYHTLTGMRWTPPTGITIQWSQLLPNEITTRPAAWDANLDGLTDILFQVNETGSPQPTYRGTGFALYWGRDEGPPVPGYRTDAPGSLADLRHLDGDENLDAVIWHPDGSWTRYKGLTGLNFDQPLSFYPMPLGERLQSIKQGDLDGDGLQDLLMLADGEPIWLRSLGGGDFERRSLPESPPGSLRRLDAVDLDGDGSTDVTLVVSDGPDSRLAIWIAWGEGEGRFTSWNPVDLQAYPRTILFPDLDGDGHKEIFVASWKDQYWRHGTRGEAYRGQARTFTFAGGFDLPGFNGYRYTAGDLTGDGGDEILYSAEDPDDRDRVLLTARSWTAEGGFSEPWLTFPKGLHLYGYGKAMAVTDLDGDGHNDLLLRDRWDPQRGDFLRTLRGDGAGNFIPLWKGPSAGENYPPDVYFTDLDFDGFLDVVATDSIYSGVRPFRIWRGDGTGGFLPPEKSFYGSVSLYSKLTGRFFGDYGKDMVYLAEVNYRDSFTVNPQRLYPLDGDTAPPTLELLLAPELDDFVDPPAFEKRWRVNGLVGDECGAAEVTEIRLDLASLPAEAPVHFVSDSEPSIRFYEDPDTGAMEVVLRGPDEGALRELFARVRQDGGFHLERNQLVELTTHDEFGRPPSSMGDDGAVPSGFVLTTHYRLAGKTLDAVAIHRPGADIHFFLRAQDHVGKTTEITGSFDHAREKYCGGSGATPVVCRL